MTLVLLALVGLTVSSQVDSVVVYPNYVVVVRTATVSVAGPGELVFEKLPGAMEDNTVRVNASGIEIGEVQVVKGYMAEPTPEVKALEGKVQLLEDEVKGLDDEAGVLQAKEEFLKSVKLGAPEIISKELQQGKVATESWRGALAFVGDELMKVKARQVKLAREKNQRRKLLDAARGEYNDARAAIENRKGLRFQYTAAPGTYAVRFSYAVRGVASWSPYYEMRAKPTDGKVEVTYFAKLEQRTGENWDGVKVVLSTAKPAMSGDAPIPEPWYLSLLEERPVAQVAAQKGMVQRQSVASERVITSEDFKRLPVTQLSDLVGLQAGVTQQPVSIEETEVSLQYEIPGRVTLKSGEPAKKLLLHEATFPVEFEFYALPRVLPQTFLVGKMANTTDFIFMGGQASTYVGEEYTGTSSIPMVAPQESAAASFGVDERVKVNRALVRSFKSKGPGGRTERVQFVYRITGENHHPKPVKLSLIEQVPVSKQSEIKVTVTKVEPKFLEQNRDLGTLKWKQTLNAGERFTADVEYTVEYPAGRQVQGLF
jgi:uncharacterized protein (TIGR02231 family)